MSSLPSPHAALLSLAALLFALAAAWNWIEPALLGWLMERQS